MGVEYWYSDDSFVRAEVVLRRAVGQFASRNSYIYIGLTQQKPEERFRQHQTKWAVGHKWDRMIVIYHARSFSLMQKVEDALIKYAEDRIAQGRYTCELINDIDSQRPMVAKNLNGYWIYILVQV
ncbi:MAG: hypothetical protein DWQ47_07265 [Acidobacteria bacterium]|nr:MAG: hypothetical protein DWQ32_15365 [Acidobacteriota bacterium]REJ99275.1 MAG: hypothetical protein DWQ38_14610 [Acidobacteriota bacterium]REK16004.1 MAG: hypothetical protein DWQ43_03075 [Acidobacteriota bacterium]REK43685.1 MAG: hypothetical protein DWQ47_07265 [Acidobacteriota bacterium]